MSADVQWTDTDPRTGSRRYVAVEKFAGKWYFKYRLKRRDDWTRTETVSREMWETLLEALLRRVQRREASDEDVESVRRC